MRAPVQLLMFLALFTLAACSDDDGGGLEPQTQERPTLLAIADPTVSPAPAIGELLDLGTIDLASKGYTEQEYFLSGTATSFINVNELLSDGFWEAEPGEQAEYSTRAIVRRPANSADFNGTVLVEWMNVSAGFDSTPEWNNLHVELLRQGYVWVGVTAQLVGIEGREDALVPFHLKSINPDRYESLSHPGDSWSYDIFSQLAEALRNPGEVDMLNGMQAERLIAAGESQSAFYMTTYVNAIHPLYNAYDAYIIHSRGEYASALAQPPQVSIPAPEQVLIRTDLDVPVWTFQAETDVLRETLNSVTVRQEDTELLRFWEAAGTAHADRYTLGAGNDDPGDDPSYAAITEERFVQGFIECDFPFNSGPMHFIFKAGLRQLNQWLIDGTPMPSAPYLEVSDDQSMFVLDDQGNVLGGVRTPYVDAPAAVLSGLGQTGGSFCGLFGTTRLFTAEEMAALYVDETGYVEAVTASANAAVDAGFLLPEDAELIIQWAPEQWRSAP